MKTYFSTFVSGTQKIIKKALAKRGKGDFRIISLLDGLIIYKTKYSERDIRQLRFFNNSFILFDIYKNLGKKPITQMLKNSINNKIISFTRDNLPDKKTRFKIITSLENQMTSADRNIIEKVEKNLLQNKRLSLNIKNPDKEFWFIARREKIGLSGLRITYPNKNVSINKGELRHELAHILCLVSQPAPQDIVLDPFTGYGAIPMERATAFPYKEIIAVEKDPLLIKKIESKAKNKKKNITIRQGDISEIKSNTIDKIISDPPWGIYQKMKIPISDFYTNMLDEFYRVLKPLKTATLLIGNISVFDTILKQAPSRWKLKSQHKILVSGKKATIYYLQKI